MFPFLPFHAHPWPPLFFSQYSQKLPGISEPTFMGMGLSFSHFLGNLHLSHCWIIRDAKVAEIKLFAGNTIALETEMLIFQHYVKFRIQSTKSNCEGEVRV